MSNQTSPLRQRMIDDMSLRNMSPNTQKAYIRAVAKFSAFHGRPPDKLGIEEIRAYRLHLMQRGLKATSLYPIIGAIRFFYSVTLGQKNMLEHIPYARKEDTLPAVLTQEQVVSLLKAESNIKMRTAYTTIYAAGLRVSEAVALTIHDIDSARMVIHIHQAKGQRDRIVMLSEQLLTILRDYWKRQRPSHWLFPGPNASRPVTTRSVQRAFRVAADTVGLDDTVTVHTLRHSFATHLLERGVDIRVIQDLLGHRQITSTTRYARVAVNVIRQIESPLETLKIALTPQA